ncbi:MAG: serine hydrolase [Candidatus Staskawiczbacteria bacterium]|nr:serine hydrolase [Candidatus Staskawiczbacteria bacterium]
MTNRLKFIKGFFLSFVFLLIFVYAVIDLQSFLLGSISKPIKFVEKAPENVVVKEPEINAGSALSVESNLSESNKILLSKDAEKSLPIASLTKLMTAIIVLDNYKLSSTATVDETADSQAPMKQDVKLGDTLTVEGFLQIMLVKSSNKSAYTLSQIMGKEAFVGLMNKKAKDIGLKNAFFVDPMGISSKNVSTASDLAKLAEYILKEYPKISDISRVKELEVPGFGKIENTDQLLGEVPEVVCSKTGFTTEAKGCLLLVINKPDNDGFLINVILGADDRFVEMKKLISWSNFICN